MVYRVNEIFKSIEGEGKRTGEPCTFVRLAGCNLRCSYCDTAYALRSSDGIEMTRAAIISKVLSMGVGSVTITGGEPMLQDAIGLAEHMPWNECNIETNGSILLKPKPSNVFYTMDWKSPSSCVENMMLEDNLALLDENDVIKFVVGNVEDLDAMRRVLREVGTLAQPYVSPIFGRIEPRAIVEYVLDNRIGARVQVQLHKVIWDPNERGV